MSAKELEQFSARENARTDRRIIDLTDERLPRPFVIALTRLMALQDRFLSAGRGREATAVGSSMRIVWHTGISPSSNPPITNFGDLPA